MTEGYICDVFHVDDDELDREMVQMSLDAGLNYQSVISLSQVKSFLDEGNRARVYVVDGNFHPEPTIGVTDFYAG
jgi:hypothetical protein